MSSSHPHPEGSACPWVVLKFGGTSVASLARWRTIAAIIRRRQEEGLRSIVVCSALAGVSNDLEKLLELCVSGRHEEQLRAIAGRHRAFAAELGVDSAIIEPMLDELQRLATGAALTCEASPRLRAQVMAAGELILTTLGAAWLCAAGIPTAWRDARKWLVSDDSAIGSEAQRYLSASCRAPRDGGMIAELRSIPEQAVMTQGFIAGNGRGETVLLGRGGSDVSAAYLAAMAAVSRCEIWTDVPGMYTANPRQVPEAMLLRTLDYDEAQEIASCGAKVLHPRTVAPVKRAGIPLWIRSVPRPEAEGTVISAGGGGSSGHVKAISARSGITLISMETIEMWQQVGFLADVFACFKRHGLSIDLISTSETNVTVSLDRAINVLSDAGREALVRDLSEFCQVRVVDECAFVSLVGRNIRAIWHRLGPALEVFEEQRVYMVSQAANDLNLTFVVDAEQAERLVQKLHGQLFRARSEDPLFGESWRELNEDREAAAARQPRPWWRDRGAELLDLAKAESPLYVYDLLTVRRRLDDLKAIGSADRIFYSVKANRHPAILAEVQSRGFGFECVSPGEIRHVQQLFPGIDPLKILFTPNFAGRGEYEEAFAAGVRVTLDNIDPLRLWPEVFAGRELMLRIDPGEGKGHHKYVHTAGAKSKFGVWPSQLGELSELLSACDAAAVGLHAHVGSNIFAPETWGRTALFLARIAQRFPRARAIDVGGGLGVVERPGQEPLDLAAVDAELAAVKAAHPGIEIWMEPGRFVVAEAGVLLATVNQVKRKGDYRYVGVDAGMNSLIRPALYGAYHEIVNLSRPGEPATEVVNVVGPICESGDILGYERRLPKTVSGDVLLIGTAGAYGRVMSSSYNLREPAEERVLEPR